MTEVKDFNPNQPRDPHTGEWIDSIADGMKALEGYVENPEINDHLRAGQGTTEARQLAGLIDRKGKDAPTLYRWMDSDNLTPEQRNLLTTPGGVFTEKGFSSTTSNRDVAGDLAEYSSLGMPVVFVIQGGRGLDVDALLPSAQQQEWLLQHGTRFKVVSSREELFKWRSIARDTRGKPKETKVIVVVVKPQ